MNNDWQWNSPDWQQPSEPVNYEQGLGSYPTQASSGISNPSSDGEPVPPPPLPPLSSYYAQSNYGPATPPFGIPPGGSYPFAPTPVARNRPRFWFLVPTLIFLVLCAGSIGAAVYAYNTVLSKVAQVPGIANTGPTATAAAAAGPVIITIGAHPTIVIDRNAGAVQIQGVADSQQVVLKPIASDSPLSDGQILYNKSSDGKTITFDLSNIETVAVLLMVPAISDLNITTNSDDITVTGVMGQQQLSSNGGSLQVTQDTLTGKSTLDTNGGSITFDGSLAPQSTDHFSTNPDPITITLPANAAFHVDITNNGGVIQSDFPQVMVSGDSASGDVGQAPLAQLEIDSNGGTIQLKKSA